MNKRTSISTGPSHRMRVLHLPIRPWQRRTRGRAQSSAWRPLKKPRITEDNARKAVVSTRRCECPSRIRLLNSILGRGIIPQLQIA